MKKTSEQKIADHGAFARTAALAFAIPSMMALCPLVGFLLGRWLGGKWGYAGAGGLIGLALGIAAGVRETVRLVRRLLSEMKSTESRTRKEP